MATLNRAFIKSNLKALASQVGGEDRLNKLSAETIITIGAHFDDVLAIALDKWVIEILDMDITVGYEVYDPHYELWYNEDASLGLVAQAWGTTERDITFLWLVPFGTYAYLCYRTLDGDDRTLILVRF